MGSDFGADFDAKVTALAEAYVAALADAGKEWDEARIMASYSLEGNGTLQCQSRLSGELSGIFVTAEMRPLVAQVRESISIHVGKPVMRWRLHIEPAHKPTIDYKLDELRQTPRWWWPDEDEYDGPVYPTTPRPIDTRDGYDYVPVADGAVISAGDALRRIHAWFSENVVFFADAFYPPASAERIAATEERLGVVFPQSVRDAYMVFDGHSLDEWVFGFYRWFPLDDMKRLGERPDDVVTVPLMKTSGAGYCYVASAVSPSDEPAFIDWEAREWTDVRLADSFGAYLVQFANELEAGEYKYREETETIVKDSNW